MSGSNTFKHPNLYVIEGLDGVGKSTTVRLLAEREGAVIITNPPDHMRAARAQAEQLPESEKRAWYLHANQEALSLAIQHIEAGETVVMDRSIASTMAFWKATEGRIATPKDVPTGYVLPHFYYLYVGEEERQKRWSERQVERTKEEQRLCMDSQFRDRVDKGYRHLGGIPVSAEFPPERVVEIIIALQKGLLKS